MRVIIKDCAADAAEHAAHYITDRVNAFGPTAKKPFVLALSTGTTMIPVYTELIRLHEAGEISFQHVVTFNVDEFVGLSESHVESYHSFMWTHLFKHIDITPENVYILDGNARNLDEQCKKFEETIARFGGIELCLGGIAQDGHFGFNEPGSSLASRTRVKTLAHHTIVVNTARFGGDYADVPKQAVTMGVGTVLESREVLIVICGESKAMALQKCLEEAVNHMWTVSCLQHHARAVIVCDDDATVELKVKTVRYFKGMQLTMRTLIHDDDTDGHHHAGERARSKRERSAEEQGSSSASTVAEQSSKRRRKKR
jgi:glucosamine-6-phosphate deaminase